MEVNSTTVDKPKKMLNLSVVVAAYDEESVILDSIRLITAELNIRPAVDWELICINDGSRDRTGELLDKAAAHDPRIRVLHHRRNFGQGRALRTAFDICRGDTIVTLDADMSYDPKYIYLLMDALQKNKVEIALASPYTKGGEVRNVPFYRYLLSRWGNRYLAKMSSYRISTSTCVVRAYHREVLDNLVFTSDGMELQLEILMKAAMMGFRVCEIPAKLEWGHEKAANAGLQRVSKMRILQTIRLYLLMGWISRPAFFFILCSFLLIIPGIVIAYGVALRFFQTLSLRLSYGFLNAISDGLKYVTEHYSHSIIFSTIFLLFGFLVLAFSLVLLQNKYYFEELFRLEQQTLRNANGKRINSEQESL